MPDITTLIETVTTPIIVARVRAATEMRTEVIPARTLRILIVASEAPPVHGGVARFVQVLRDGLMARGHKVDLVSYPQIPRVTLGEVRFSGLLFKLRTLGRRLDQYDLIHLHGVAPTFSEVFLGYLRMQRVCPPLVYTHHFDMDLRPAGPVNTLYNWVHNRLVEGAAAVVTTSHDYAARFADRANTLTIEPGMNTARFTEGGTRTGPFTVLFVGQFRGYKGVRVLMQAMTKVAGARLVVAGRGPEEAAYRALAATLGIAVEFHVGPSDAEVDALFQQAQVIVLPSVSRLEAFGIVLLEGMAAGCVPVASNLPGVREVVGRIGFTFPVGRSDRLAAVLRRLRDDPALVAQISVRARERAASYTWERFLNRYERLYQNVIAAEELRQTPPTPDDAAADLHAFMGNVIRAFGASQAHILRVDAHGTLGSVAGADMEGRYTSVLPAHEGIAQYSYTAGEAVRITPNHTPQPLAAQRALNDSLLCAPIDAAAHPFGVLLVTRAEPFDGRDLDDLVYLARQAAPALLRRMQSAPQTRGEQTR